MHIDFVGREISAIITKASDLEAFFLRNLHECTYETPNPSVTTLARIDEVYVLDVTPRPFKYPYLVLAHYDNERETIRAHYISQEHLQLPADSDDVHLFEFRIKRTDLEPPYRVRESDYQIPAKDILTAHLMLGQTHHNVDKYDLDVLSWVQVK